MPILVSCPCGKKFRVADEHAGKRIKCAGCGDPVTVPAEEEEAPARAAPLPTLVRFECPECGKAMQAKSTFAGERVDCPRCRAEVEVPDAEAVERREAGSRIQSDRPAPKKRVAASVARNGGRRHEEDEDERRFEDEEEEEERPRKSKKGKKSGASLALFLVLGGALLFVVLGGGAVGAYFLFFHNRGPTEEAMIPPDAQLFVTVRVADVWQLEATQRLYRKYKAETGQDFVEEMRKKANLDMDDIEKMTMVFMDLEGVDKNKELWVIVTLKKRYDRKKVLEDFVSPREVSYEGRSYHVGRLRDTSPTPPPGLAGMRPAGPQPDKEELAVFFASRKVLVFGPEPGIKRLFRHLKVKKPTGPLAETIKAAQKSNRHLVAGFTVPASARNQLKGAQGELASLVSVLDVQSGRIEMDFGDTTTLELTGRYDNDGKAQEAKRNLDNLLALGRTKLGEGLAGEMLQTVTAIYDRVKVTQSGPEVTIKGSITGGEIDRLSAQKAARPAPPWQPAPQPRWQPAPQPRWQPAPQPKWRVPPPRRTGR
jgi:hypothetical protein